MSEVSDADRGIARAAYPRRIAGVPLIERVRVALEGTINIPDRLRDSDFEVGATTTIIMFPGDPDAVGAWAPEPPPQARRRRGGGELTVPAPVHQTVSNLRRAELDSEDLVPPGRLEILEGFV